MRDNLARLYLALEPRERFQLLLDAMARGDDKELDRLAGRAATESLNFTVASRTGPRHSAPVDTVDGCPSRSVFGRFQTLFGNYAVALLLQTVPEFTPLPKPPLCGEPR